MYILDALIIVGFIIGILGGIRRGVIKSTVLLVGLIVILIISYYLKNPLSAFFYKTLPFFSFKGAFQGAPIVNVILYEILAFIVVFTVLYLILRIVLHISHLLEKVLNATIILGFISSIGGAIVGFVEAYVIIFVALFICTQPFLKITGTEESWLGNKILDSSPILTSYVKDTRDALKELDDLRVKYGNNKKEYNKRAIELFLRYDIISEENVEILKDKGKL